MQSPAKRDHANLDLLRAIAVLAVLADHVLEYVGGRIGVAFHPVDWQLGRLGVLLFFVHTSYVLMLSLQRLHGSGGRVYVNFMIRRAFRILPLSVLAVAVVVLLEVPAMGWMPRFVPPTGGELLANLALVQNLTYSRDILAPLWSLPLEMQMYVALPLLFAMVARPTGLRSVAALWLVSVAVALVQPGVAGRLTVAQFGPCFVAGAVTYVVSRRVAPRLPAWGWPPALAGVVVGYLLAATVSGEVHPAPLAWTICLATGLLIPLFRDVSHARIVRVAHLVARYSYGVYLSHIILMWLVFVRMPALTPALQAAVLLALLIVVPAACYHLVEEPFMRVGARMAERLAAFEWRLRRGATRTPVVASYAFVTVIPNTSSASSAFPNGAET